LANTRSRAAEPDEEPAAAPEETTAPARKRARKKAAAKKTPAKKPAARTAPKTSTRSRSKSTGVSEERIAELFSGLQARLDAIEARLPAGRPRPEGDAPAPPRDLAEGAGRLSEALEEVPRAADFEPLAEHIYELARHAPRLLEALEAVPGALAPFEQSVAALRETAETLQYVHESFAESLLRLPRAEDYEPLSQPLAEFARVSPALAQSLADVLRVTAPLGDAVTSLRRVTEELRGLRGPAADPGLREPLELAAGELRDARAALSAALSSLPRDPEYKRVANQLREIASVSPSLMDWMEQVTPLSRPLGESVASLRAAEGRLDAATVRLLDLIDRLS